jgi:hypothetical protein
MKTTDNEVLAKALEDIRRRICCYGGGTRCDCKYGRDVTAARQHSEASGCPEMIEVINRLMHRPNSFAEDAETVLRRFVSSLDETLTAVGIADPLRGAILGRFLYGHTGRIEDLAKGQVLKPT